MRIIFFSVFALLLLSSCGAGEEETVSEGADSFSFPVDTLVITGYIGEELGDSTNTFGILADAEFHEGTGNILILDSGACCFKEYSPQGEYIRQISRQGSGPGEFSFATLEFFQIGGKSLALDRQKLSFIVFDDSLEYLEELSTSTQNQPMHNMAISDTLFASYKPDFEEAGEGSFVMFRRIVIYPYGAEDYDVVLWEDSMELTISDLISDASDLINDFMLGVTLGGNEDLILFSLKEAEDYTVHAWYPDGSSAFTISLPLEPVPKTDEEIAEEKAYMEGFMGQMGAEMEFTPELYRDMIISVDIGPDGNIWVQRGTTSQPFFDIFDMEGTLIGHKVFSETGWSWRFSLSSQGILAWEDDPELGYQQLFIIQ